LYIVLDSDDWSLASSAESDAVDTQVGLSLVCAYDLTSVNVAHEESSLMIDC